MTRARASRRSIRRAHWSAGTTYTVTLRGGAAGIRDLSGEALVRDVVWIFTTRSTSGFTIWPGTTIPGTIDNTGDINPVELGVRFRAESNGSIRGIRFFRSAANVGAHTVTLWSESGAVLASAPFTSTPSTPEGWQEVLFASPVAITANQTYIASYHAPGGHYSVNGNYFVAANQAAFTRPPLRALVGGEDGPNGVFGYGGPQTFPNGSFGDGNYWVDVVFDLPANQPPVAVPNSYSTAKNTPLTVNAPGVLGNDTDPEAAQLSATLVSPPAHGALTLNVDGSFTYTPQTAFVGTDAFTYSASDGSLSSGAATVTITVTDPNSAPVAVNDAYSTNEDTQLTVSAPGILANDTDDTGPLTAVLVDVPTSGSLVPNANGSFAYTPTADFNGTDSFTYRASDGALTSGLATVTITVNPVNDAPVLAAIGNKTVAENALLTFTISATDVDSGTLTYAATGLPTGATFDPATRTFSWTPTFAQSGSHPVTFTVTDNGTPVLSDSEAITITVTNINRAPVLAAIGNKTVAENALLTFVISATDADGDTLTYAATGLPTGATFTPATRTFSWTPTSAQAGSYPVTFTATDDGTPVLSANEAITITVTNVNTAPVLAAIGNKTVAENALLTFTISATDADGDTLTYAATGLPTGATFDPPTRTFSWTPSYTQSGSYPVTFTATDNGTPVLAANETITITVTNVNRAPVLAAIGNKTVAENALLTFVISATDADGDTLTYAATGLPTGATFTPATRTFSWTPTFDQSGSHPVTFTATDNGTPVLAANETITITVTNVNRAPVLAAIGNKTVAENALLTFVISATDADGDTLTYAATGLPTGATFTPATRTFSWTPTFAQSGSYPVTFTATDNGTPVLSANETITITVTNTNRAPALAAIGNKTVAENALLTFTISATDADGDTLTYAATGLPTGATFDPPTRTFSWTPSYTQSGSYPVTFTATDNGTPVLAANETITITVTNVNRAPALAAIGNKTVAENALLTFVISATDADGDTLTYAATGLPTGATFTPATRTFSWTPTFDQSGSHPVTFTATDNGTPVLAANETITITVTNVNRAPVLAAIGNKTVAENALLTFVISATDADGDTLTYAATGLPTGATFTPATRTFSWTPTFAQSGSYPVTFTATDNGTPVLAANETITITVTNTNRAPALAAIGNKTVAENALLTFTISATDADGDTLTYAATGLPTGATFDPPTRTFSWTPSYTQSGSYPVTFTATDNGTPVLAANETITITVTNVNRAPALAAIGNKTVAENALLTFVISATDADGDTLTYAATGLPTGATFTPATRTFSWTPTFDAVGQPPGDVHGDRQRHAGARGERDDHHHRHERQPCAGAGGDWQQDGGGERVVDVHHLGDRCRRRHADLRGDGSAHRGDVHPGDADVQLDADVRPVGQPPGDVHGDRQRHAGARGERDDHHHRHERQPCAGAGGDWQQDGGGERPTDVRHLGDRCRWRHADLRGHGSAHGGDVHPGDADVQLDADVRAVRQLSGDVYGHG